ncbi:MAG: M24 family metallopeptidase [Bacteroidota bacterium]|jgi:Xaa-Pro aminopeptidase
MKSAINFLLIFLTACSIVTSQVDRIFDHFNNPWPKIRKERIETLLPSAMKEAEIDSWLNICRENDNDPLAIHFGGENAGGTAAFLFFLQGDKVYSAAVSPSGEARALKDVGLHNEVIEIERGYSVWIEVKKLIEKFNPVKIGINSSQRNLSDGLSYTQRIEMEKELGAEISARFVSSDPIVVNWLSVKLPAEIEIMTKAALLTEQIQIDAYKSVVPGKTTDADVARFIKKRMMEYGVKDAWQPDQNPNVNSGVDRGHSHSTDKVIQPGDIIQTDHGIKVYGIWVTDIQRFAYVLKPGEIAAPQDIQLKWENAKRGSRIVIETMKPGIEGFYVDKAQREWMKQKKSLPVIWSTGHPVGYVAHDVGPSLGGAQRSEIPLGSSALKLKPGQVFAYDGFFCWYIDETKTETKTISVEEMAVVTEVGAKYLIPPQEKLILIPYK